MLAADHRSSPGARAVRGAPGTGQAQLPVLRAHQAWHSSQIQEPIRTGTSPRSRNPSGQAQFPNPGTYWYWHSSQIQEPTKTRTVLKSKHPQAWHSSHSMVLPGLSRLLIPKVHQAWHSSQIQEPTRTWHSSQIKEPFRPGTAPKSRNPSSLAQLPNPEPTRIGTAPKPRTPSILAQIPVPSPPQARLSPSPVTPVGSGFPSTAGGAPGAVGISLLTQHRAGHGPRAGGTRSHRALSHGLH